ncbi:hypothetical protein GCM10027423_51440 [Spirosoma arcticum]
MNTFFEDWKSGIVQPDQIDDYIDRWHSGNSDLPLAAFLGLTQDQYARWLTTPQQLLQILQESP